MTQADIHPDGMTLKAARVNAGLTQKTAAKMLNISEATLINYEAGKSFPDVRTIKRIEEVYKIPYQRIIFLV